MRLPRPVLLLLALLAAAAAPGPPPAAAQDAPDAPDLNDTPPKPLTPEEEKAARALFAEARALVDKGYGIPARKKFEEFLDRYPGADEEMLQEADDRCGPNFLAGIELQHDAGPPERRLDVELMGDGYTLSIFRKFKGDALSQMVEFWKDPLYDEYASYINVWRFDLVSKEEGVDDVSDEDKGIPPPEDPKKRKRYEKKLKRMKRYSTALDCKAAGPARQVMANSEQVIRWRQYLKCSDGLTIAFANKGELGMGGGGIATTGKKVAVTHEFGHAFIGLLDEYANNPNRPGYRIFAPNAISSDDPDPRKPPSFKDVPWSHWFAANGKPLTPEVKILCGGATYQQGCFRPADSCAMNSAGSAFYCPVCRETGVLRIYSYVNPIDESGPVLDRVQLTGPESKEFFVTPMQPKSHALKVDWTLQVIATGPQAAVDEPALPLGGESFVRDERAGGMWQREGDRASARRSNPLPEGNPKGSALKAVARKVSPTSTQSVVKVGDLPPGVYRLTARVLDDTKVPKYGYPWVVKDPDRLREEWRVWTLDVAPAPSAPAPANPPPKAPPAK